MAPRVISAATGKMAAIPIFFFQAEDGIRDLYVTGVPDVCSSDLFSVCLNLQRSWRNAVRDRSYRLFPDRARVCRGAQFLKKIFSCPNFDCPGAYPVEAIIGQGADRKSVV